MDGRLLIDFPADTYAHTVYGGLDLREIRACLITHSHSDHFYPADFEMRRPGFCTPTDDEKFIFYAGASAKEMTEAILEKYTGLDTRIAVREIQPFTPFETTGYTVTPLPANHDAGSTPLIFLIERDGKALLYGNDTGFFHESVVSYLTEQKKHIDLLSLDCTGGLIPGSHANWHMNLITVREQIELLSACGVIDGETKRVITHFSHNGLATYDEMAATVAPDGIMVAYDGFTVTC